MFAVIYRFEIKSDIEEEFIEAWKEATLAIQAHHHHRGSRLHQNEEKEWIAYTVWDTREKWERRNEGPPELQAALAKMGRYLEKVEVLHHLDVRGDLLGAPPHT